MDNETISNNNMKVFKERLKELRGSKSLNEVAQALGISRATLGYYENGDRKPDVEMLLRITNYYQVSSDYLLGITDVKSVDIDIKSISEKTGLNENSIEILFGYKSFNDNHPECDIEKIYLTTIDDILNFNILIEDIAHYLYFQFDCAYGNNNHKNTINSSEITFLDKKIGKPFVINSEYIAEFLLLRVNESLKMLRKRYTEECNTPLINEIPFVSQARSTRTRFNKL